MNKSRTLLLNHHQISQKINRIAYQIYEDNYDEKEIIILGIWQNGYILAEKIQKALNGVCDIKTTLLELRIDKHSQVDHEVVISGSRDVMVGKSIILVDDVLNSGKTLIYSMKAILRTDTRKIRTVLLVDRDHRRYPILTDFVGMTLSTTFQEHVSVEFGDEDAVYLS
ncbi:MAG: phosphoribosyltransferase [Bacteroidia bacterium]|nr:phosphoribosyltransferase [Bacteroidota bacterium]MBL7913486.1 phosphoribosyltransferase [Bacteroidia bacterium]MBK7967718.1 phosphoribosyltransferase [Bacteroidota bacterium]MBK8415034.1 phosphoribosyltransferase [Bacteroidota bacterium]MBK9049175.1 phosphoribosyltransferase [Bacteroidota bacterium]